MYFHVPAGLRARAFVLDIAFGVAHGAPGEQEHQTVAYFSTDTKNSRPGD